MRQILQFSGIDIPTQTTLPLPLYPSGHKQVYEPGVLTQLASELHLKLPTVHSSISDKEAGKTVY